MDNNHFNQCSSSTSNNGGNNKKKSNVKKGKGVKLSTDPQSVAARERRHRISERFKILQSLIPGGSKMDTVSMLEEAIQYVKFLKTQIWLHQAMINYVDDHDPRLSSLQTNNIPLPPQQQQQTIDQYSHAMPQVGFPDYYIQDDEEETMSFDARMMY